MGGANVSKPTKPRKPRGIGSSWGTPVRVFSSGVGVVVDSFVTTPSQARRIADWLTRWADWKEAQK